MCVCVCLPSVGVVKGSQEKRATKNESTPINYSHREQRLQQAPHSLPLPHPHMHWPSSVTSTSPSGCRPDWVTHRNGQYTEFDQNWLVSSYVYTSTDLSLACPMQQRRRGYTGYGTTYVPSSTIHSEPSLAISPHCARDQPSLLLGLRNNYGIHFRKVSKQLYRAKEREWDV